MKFVHGKTLLKAISEAHRESPHAHTAKRRLLENFVDVCDAVAYAHSRGVLHRDLKPSNVMLGEFGETLVVDWGVAKVVDQPDVQGEAFVSLTGSGLSYATEANAVIGTAAYISPEMASGNAAEAGVKADVYLLGATLYHILTNQAPRRGSSQHEILEMAREAEPENPRRIKRNVPKRLEAICLKAMAHDSDVRYDSGAKSGQGPAQLSCRRTHRRLA